MTRSKRNASIFFALAIGASALVGSANAEEAATPADEKHISGMSILGNDESPKSLVIVPWKSSDLGDDLDLSRRFGQDRSPLDPEVFARSLDYHAIRTGRSSR